MSIANNPEEAYADEIERYKSSHWGIEPAKVRHVDDPDVPDVLVEMGLLREFNVEVDGENFDMVFPKGCRLVFATTPDERLYCILTAGKRKWCKKHLWDVGKRHGVPTMKLGAAANNAGGRQADYSYPSITVMVVGTAHDVVYSTHKKGDGPSHYVHEFGEESGMRPLLCVDVKGRLWLAGGNYTCPDAGITD